MTGMIILAFAGGAFPRIVRVATEDLEIRIPGPGVLYFSYSLAVIGGEAPVERQGDVLDASGRAFAHTLSVLRR